MAAPDLDMLLGEIPLPARDPEPEMGEDDGLEAGAQELIDAVGSGDRKAVVAAFRAMFEMLEAKPHVEAGEELDEME
jgi:predicted lipid-binding transport protein (Tim44 family)